MFYDDFKILASEQVKIPFQNIKFSFRKKYSK